eukprot:gnl/TRDRNA2_/TRDRNA2_111889_c0_seq1.p1 gnl/TRDRNA2_/TRDRNA2_111889_c0~~gnl/TRDRNA2_/TRDRNA2_111889_c0_seq1.p1  ORF type:complete len:672 (+),score=223.21 gnl/TRDRNA2_/TRDRNA2_111889_c0_seq1:43-2016(+)
MADDMFPASDMEMQEQVARLVHEKRDLQEYADRVTKELRRYQQARPMPAARAEDDLPLPPWATDMQMMSPLLFSYEERIVELEAVIDRSVNLAEQAQALSKENDALRVELQERTEQLRQAQLMAPVRDIGPDGIGGDQQLDELQELYRLSVEQNEALAQQNQLLKLQLERMQQTITVGQQQVNSQHAKMAEGMKSVQELQQANEELASQRAAAEERLEELSLDLAEHLRQKEELQLRVGGLQHELKLQCNSLELYRKSFEDRCALATEEEERLRTDLNRAMNSDKEQRQRIGMLERELAEVSEQFFVTRREANVTKQEAEQMIKLMESMERRLKDISERYDVAQAKILEQENQVAELLLEKDRWTTAEQAAKKHAERLESRQQSELEMARQQRESAVESLQGHCKKQVESLEDRLRRSEQEVSELQMKTELAERQRSWDIAAHQRQTAGQNAEKARLLSDAEEAQQARLRADRLADSAQEEVRKLREELAAASVEAEKVTQQARDEANSYRSNHQRAERALSQAREEVQTLQSRERSLEADNMRVKAELQEERFSASDTLEAEKRSALAVKRGLERQLQNLAARSQQEEQRAVELLRAQEALRLKWQAELDMEKENLESQVERLSADNRTLREKSRGVLKVLAAQQLMASEEIDTPR